MLWKLCQQDKLVRRVDLLGCHMRCLLACMLSPPSGSVLYICILSPFACSLNTLATNQGMLPAAQWLRIFTSAAASEKCWMAACTMPQQWSTAGIGTVIISMLHTQGFPSYDRKPPSRQALFCSRSHPLSRWPGGHWASPNLEPYHARPASSRQDRRSNGAGGAWK